MGVLSDKLGLQTMIRSCNLLNVMATDKSLIVGNKSPMLADIAGYSQDIHPAIVNDMEIAGNLMSPPVAVFYKQIPDSSYQLSLVLFRLLCSKDT